ncbi:MAG: CvpA family protein [Clostridia bacterium]|nr:CvpA family protein [Clostridia bacterium]
MIFGLSFLDLVLLIVLIISAIVGLVKGFAQQFFSFISLIIVVTISCLLCEWFGQCLYPVFGKSMENGFAQWIIQKDVDGLFTTAQDWTNAATVTKALEILDVPPLISDLLSAVIESAFDSFGSSGVLCELLPRVLAKWAMTGIAFLVLLIMLSIIVFIVKCIVFKFVEKPGVSVVNRLLGALVGVVYTYAVWSVYLTLINTFVAGIPLFSFIQNLLVAQSNASINGWFPIFHFMYNYNFIGGLLINVLMPK